MDAANKFTVIYSFEVKDGMASEFVSVWTELTKLIYQYEGSFGSRLHHAQDGLYIAYAQWPDRETWAKSGDRLPESAAKTRKRMRECCSSIKTEYELTVVSDLLRSERYDGQNYQ